MHILISLFIVFVFSSIPCLSGGPRSGTALRNTHRQSQGMYPTFEVVVKKYNISNIDMSYREQGVSFFKFCGWLYFKISQIIGWQICKFCGIGYFSPQKSQLCSNHRKTIFLNQVLSIKIDCKWLFRIARLCSHTYVRVLLIDNLSLWFTDQLLWN